MRASYAYASSAIVESSCLYLDFCLALYNITAYGTSKC